MAHSATDADHNWLLRLDGVGRTYQMGEVAVNVLRNISLDVHPGELLVMVGPSGSGKTTILNLVGGMDKPTTGEIWYRERDLTRATDAELTRYRRDAIGFVFQFYNLVPTLKTWAIPVRIPLWSTTAATCSVMSCRWPCPRVERVSCCW